MSWYQVWFYLPSKGWRFRGWAWCDLAAAQQVNFNCTGRSVRFLKEAPGNAWERMWAARTPSYSGVPSWYHVWGAGAPRRFMAHLYVGYHTAKMIKTSCLNTDVVTRIGQPL
jgi:hypothetical protein